MTARRRPHPSPADAATTQTLPSTPPGTWPSTPPSSTSSPGRRGVLRLSVASLGLLGARAAQPQAVPAALDLTAQTTEGPYFLPGLPLREDITEGKTGVPLEVRLRVVDAQGLPLAGARVDLWQCDAGGLYSGYAGQGDDRRSSTVGQTWLRGGQLSGADGGCAFRTLYPGWYAGRTTHIHFKVTRGGRHWLTSQFFLPDALSEFVYTTLPDYRRQALRDVLNRSDGIALMTGPTTLGTVREEAQRYVASLQVVANPAADVPAHRPGPGSGPPPEALRAGASGVRAGPPPGFGGTPALPPLQGTARVQALVPGPAGSR